MNAKQFCTEENLEGKIKDGELSNQTDALKTVFKKHYVGWIGKETEVKDTSYEAVLNLVEQLRNWYPSLQSLFQSNQHNVS